MPHPPIPILKISNNKWVKLCLWTAVVILAIFTAAIPGILQIMRRADAQTALGNAKSLRLALQAASMECYAADRSFHDISGPGGVTEEVWRKVITDSKVPGDFWILQMDENGYEVQCFLYQEGGFTVTYHKDPLVYAVSYGEEYIRTSFPGQKEDPNP